MAERARGAVFGLCAQWESLAIRELEFWAAYGAVQSGSGRVRGGKGRFLDDITNGIWCICEESFWGVPAHIGVQKAGSGLPDTAEPIVDLFAAETSELLAWTVYLLGAQLDAVSPLIVPRIAREMQYRILTPLLEREDFGWMGYSGARVNNWNPWIVSNWLTSTLLMETDDARRVASVFKAMQAVDHFIDPYPKDGGVTRDRAIGGVRGHRFTIVWSGFTVQRVGRLMCTMTRSFRILASLSTGYRLRIDILSILPMRRLW